jgi:hypothetical protein
VLYLFLAVSFLKHWFPARDDPEQNRYHGEDEKDMNQAAECPGRQAQQS